MSSLISAAPPRTSISEVIKEVVFSENQISQRVREVAAEISSDYKNGDLVVVGILKGAYIFTCDLVRQLSKPVSVDFVSISRYKRAPGLKEVRLTEDLVVDIAGRNLLLVEDIVDTGLTLNYLLKVLKQRNPNSIKVCALLDRPTLRLADIPVEYVGFNISEEFLIGYGLDYRDRYRELPFIASMDL